jgi:hypothetical protein
MQLKIAHKVTLENTERGNQNGQSRETGNTGNSRLGKTKQMLSLKMCANFIRFGRDLSGDNVNCSRKFLCIFDCTSDNEFNKGFICNF